MVHAPVDPGVGNVVLWILLSPVDRIALFVKIIFEIASLPLEQLGQHVQSLTFI